MLVSDQPGSGDNLNYRLVIIARATCHVSDLPHSGQPLSLEVSRGGEDTTSGLQGQARVGSWCPGVSEGRSGDRRQRDSTLHRMSPE